MYDPKLPTLYPPKPTTNSSPHPIHPERQFALRFALSPGGRLHPAKRYLSFEKKTRFLSLFLRESTFLSFIPIKFPIDTLTSCAYIHTDHLWI